MMLRTLRGSVVKVAVRASVEQVAIYMPWNGG